MSLAFLGAHRTGKSTLARAFAQKNNVPFVQTGASEVFKILGLDPKAEYPIDRRIAIQAAILHALEAQWTDAQRRSVFYVSDRSPLDLAGYLLADVTRQTLQGQPEVAMAVNGYVAKCIDSANRFFGTLVLVQPGIEVVEADGKAPACPAYMEHLNQTMSGLLYDDRVTSQSIRLQRGVVDLDERVASVEAGLRGVMDIFDASLGRDMRKGRITVH